MHYKHDVTGVVIASESKLTGAWQPVTKAKKTSKKEPKKEASK